MSKGNQYKDERFKPIAGGDLMANGDVFNTGKTSNSRSSPVASPGKSKKAERAELLQRVKVMEEVLNQTQKSLA